MSTDTPLSLPPLDAAYAGLGVADLETIARKLRFKVIEMSHAAGTPHLGSALSCIDILVALFWKVARVSAQHAGDPLRDRGRAAPRVAV